jgi:cell division protein FtsI/penicillin-binding protein 2
MVNKGRLRFLGVFVTVFLLIVCGRLTWIQVVKAQEITAKSEAMRVQTKTINTLRGKIMDRNLKTMAQSIPYYVLRANHLQITTEKDENRVADELAPILGKTRDQILKLLHDNPSNGYIKVQDQVTLAQKQQIDNVKPALPGLWFEDYSTRIYPGRAMANQVLGYMNPDGAGGDGLEKFYNEYLSGKPGYVRAEFTIGNTPMENTIKDQVDPVPGQDLVLTIDMGLQKLVEDKLDAVVKEQDAKRALGIVMDIHTGEILVMAMRPGADPADRKTWGDPVDWGRIKNWAAGESMSPGSIFKQVTTSAALEEHAITLTTPFIDKGYLPLNGCTITNWDGYTDPNPTPVTIDVLLQHSSNVGLTQVGQRVGHDNFVKYLKAFGFMETTGIDLPYEEGAKGLENFDKKGECDWANMSIGQHLEVTPIQMITAAAAVANGGNLVQPHLVRERRDPDGKVVWTAPTSYKRQVISPETAKEMRDLMVSVIEKGTAGAAMMKEYTTGGKTGTAQKFENGKMKDRMLADFVGFAPASNPQYEMLLMVDEPKGQGFGGMIAAPAYGELMPQVLHALGVPPDKKGGSGPEKAPAPAVSGVVPDVTWMPTAWALSRLSDAGFVPRTKGDGNYVSAQSIKAGTSTKPGSIVEVTTVKVPDNSDPVHVPDFTGLSLTQANRLATEIGLTLQATGSGFVAGQTPAKGTTAPARSTLSVRLAPRP